MGDTGAAEETGMEQVPTVVENDLIEGLFDIEGLDIASYRIRGEGPDGAYFDWIEATEPRIAIADVRRGQWTIYAQGLNAEGMPVVQGKLETFLSEDSPVDNLIFNESYSTGNARCALAWNPVQVQHPNIEVYVKPVDGEYMARDVSEIVVGNGTAMWTAYDLPSGSYIARFVLKDRNTVVSGAAAALRIIDDKMSVGNVRLTIGDLSHVFGIDISNIPVDTIEGALAVKNNKIVFESEYRDLLTDWFIDGEYIEGQDDVVLTLDNISKGYHRIDVIARTADYGSIDSDSIHIYTDGVRMTEVAEEDVNAAVTVFESTLDNANRLQKEIEEAAAAEAAGTETEEEKEFVKPIPSEAEITYDHETVLPILNLEPTDMMEATMVFEPSTSADSGDAEPVIIVE